MENELMNVNNEMMINENGFIADLTSVKTQFCSLEPKNEKDRALLFKVMNNPENRLGDFINTTIKVKDVYVEVVDCHNDETGETTQCPRIVFIDENGVGYQCVSLGIFSALKKLFQIFGTPTWKTPIPLTIKQITKGDRKLLTFDIAIK